MTIIIEWNAQSFIDELNNLPVNIISDMGNLVIDKLIKIHEENQHAEDSRYCFQSLIRLSSRIFAFTSRINGN